MNGLGGVKRVVVIGLGMTGLSVVHHLVRQSVAYDLDLEIKVIDTRATPPGRNRFRAVLNCAAANGT
ncbi:FAD/NAD(P)-binding protein [Photobacterium swingsii]|uniref:FAD/NAD(P)-binding protein n=1 Tax=Photobacterium swingsii TaxID=680026 RepID=UPI000AE69EF5